MFWTKVAQKPIFALRAVYLGSIFFLLFGCSSMPEKKIRLEGKKIVRELVAVLKQVENHEELQASTPCLKKKFNKLAALLLQIRFLQEKNKNLSFPDEPLEGSEALFAELARLYEIPGCREMIEQTQAEAVYCLLAPK